MLFRQIAPHVYFQQELEMPLSLYFSQNAYECFGESDITVYRAQYEGRWLFKILINSPFGFDTFVFSSEFPELENTSFFKDVANVYNN